MHWLEQLSRFRSGSDLPLYHAERNTHLELRLSKEGQFLGASLGVVRAIIPVTEYSAARTSGIAPHALFDTVEYLLGGERTCVYLEALRRWAGSEYGCDTLWAVHSYVSGGSIVHDLAAAGFKTATLYNAVVRFSVDGRALWEDEKLRDSYIRYMRSRENSLSLCHLTGEMSAAALMCPAELLGSGSRAKLISRDEGDRIVWRGRTADSREIFSAGYEQLFHSHAALSRMVAEHGMRCGSRVFLCWDEVGICHTLELSPRCEYAVPVGEVTVLGLDEVTRGRVSVTFMRRLSGKLFTNRISFIGISLKRIAELAFGRRDAEGVYICDSGLLAQTVERLLGSVLDGHEVARDIMTALRQRSHKNAETAMLLDALVAYNEHVAERKADVQYY